MTDVSPVPLETLEANIRQQINTSQEVLKVVDQLAAAAKDQSNTDVTPAIAPQLQRLAELSKTLSESAGVVAQKVADGLPDA